jgi:(S)-sulfolactate dehydrogenase
MSASIVVPEFMSEAAVARLTAKFRVRYEPKLSEDRARLLDLVADADALIVRNATRVDSALLARGARLRVVGRLGVGLDNIDVAACAARGIDVIPATGANALTVAEYVICVAMMLLRGAYLASGAVAAGEWPRRELGEGHEIAGKTLGVVGFGSIGRATAKLARAIGMRVVATDAMISADSTIWDEIGVTHCALDALLAEADVVTLHVPLTDDTRHLIDATRMARMKQGAVLINTARGGVIDEAALVAALKRGQLGGAALDVFEREPLAAQSPLAEAPNLLLTPHIAGITVESNERVSTLIAEKVAAALERRTNQ